MNIYLLITNKFLFFSEIILIGFYFIIYYVFL